jgi:multisubunit Na+/H+ antiporter MnhG subunit
MAAPGSDDQSTESLYDSTTPTWQPGSSVDYPPLSGVPLYLRNLIAAIVASFGIMIGSIGTWAVGDGTTGLGGMDVPDSWGVITLILGAASAIALFAQLNWGRTSFSLQWAVPLVWVIVVASVCCLAIASMQAVECAQSFIPALASNRLVDLDDLADSITNEFPAAYSTYRPTSPAHVKEYALPGATETLSRVRVLPYSCSSAIRAQQ